MDLDIMAIIQEYSVIPVAAVCFLLGWLLKHVWAEFPNKFIPLIILPVAVVGVLWLDGWAVTPDNILAGVCTAALAVYLHQIGKHLIPTATTETKTTDTGGE